MISCSLTASRANSLFVDVRHLLLRNITITYNLISRFWLAHLAMRERRVRLRYYQPYDYSTPYQVYITDVTSATQVILILRLYAMFGRSKRVLTFALASVALVLACEGVIMFFAIETAIGKSITQSSQQMTHRCLQMPPV